MAKNTPPIPSYLSLSLSLSLSLFFHIPAIYCWFLFLLFFLFLSLPILSKQRNRRYTANWMVSKSCFCCIPLRTAVTAIALLSTTFYIGVLIWLSKGRNVVYNFPPQTVSTAIAAFWSLMTIISMYLISSVFGVIGSITQKKNMIDVFRFLYWTMAMIILLSSSLLWIVLTFKQDTILAECQSYVTSLSSPQNMSSTASLPSYTSSPSSASNIISSHSLLYEECITATKQFLTFTGVLVFIGNLLQLYFATTINAYARRLKLNSSVHYKRLHLADDYREVVTKIALH